MDLLCPVAFFDEKDEERDLGAEPLEKISPVLASEDTYVAEKETPIVVHLAVGDDREKFVFCVGNAPEKDPAEGITLLVGDLAMDGSTGTEDYAQFYGLRFLGDLDDANQRFHARKGEAELIAPRDEVGDPVFSTLVDGPGGGLASDEKLPDLVGPEPEDVDTSIGGVSSFLETNEA